MTVHFINRDGEKITVKGSPGESLLDVVINEDLDIDGFGMEYTFEGLNLALEVLLAAFSENFRCSLSVTCCFCSNSTLDLNKAFFFFF